ncbi:MAG: hypothetical protein C4589_10055 [Peptococcaceae bacterium]|nr:MAG: hypothetical protein C4589_10055 [Peptococcaceae bacterium]
MWQYKCIRCVHFYPKEKIDIGNPIEDVGICNINEFISGRREKMDTFEHSSDCEFFVMCQKRRRAIYQLVGGDIEKYGCAR